MIPMIYFPIRGCVVVSFLGLGPILYPRKNSQKNLFAYVIDKNICSIHQRQLPVPCIKGDRLTIIILEEEYKLGVEACKNHLHGRIVWSKGYTPLTVVNLRLKLLELWSSIEKWGVTSLGKWFFEFSFSSLYDVHRAISINSWNLNQGVLNLFPWTKDFVPSTLKQTLAHMCIRI